METHQDGDALNNSEWFKSLEDKASRMMEAGQSRLTGGAPGEMALSEWEHGDIQVRHMPDDSHGILRISVGGGSTRDAQMLGYLRELQPLAKTHHAWPVEREQLAADDPLLNEYVRIAGSLGIRGEWWGPNGTGDAELIRAMRMCAPHGAGIVVHYSPYHRTSARKDGDPPDRTFRGDAEEVPLFIGSLEAIRHSHGLINAAMGTDVPIQALWLDCEKFRYLKPADQKAAEANAAIDARYIELRDAAYAALPGVPVEWFARGASTHYSLDTDIGGGWSMEMYKVSDQSHTIAAFERIRDGVPTREVTPWVALGGGYIVRETPVSPNWSRELDWDYRISWELGRDLNGGWDGVKSVVFFPGALHPRYPLWGPHFVAYVRGANGTPLMGK